MMDLLYVAIGLVLLVFAGDALVQGCGQSGLRLGIPPLVVGLTVVAFGTSAPELLVSVKAVLDDAPGIALGQCGRIEHCECAFGAGRSGHHRDHPFQHSWSDAQLCDDAGGNVCCFIVLCFYRPDHMVACADPADGLGADAVGQLPHRPRPQERGGCERIWKVPTFRCHGGRSSLF